MSAGRTLSFDILFFAEVTVSGFLRLSSVYQNLLRYYIIFKRPIRTATVKDTTFWVSPFDCLCVCKNYPQVFLKVFAIRCMVTEILLLCLFLLCNCLTFGVSYFIRFKGENAFKKKTEQWLKLELPLDWFLTEQFEKKTIGEVSLHNITSYFNCHTLHAQISSQCCFLCVSLMSFVSKYFWRTFQCSVTDKNKSGNSAIMETYIIFKWKILI